MSSPVAGAVGGTRSSSPPLGRGLGAGASAIAGRAPQGTQPGVDPPPAEDPKIDFSHSPPMNRGGARGKLVVPKENSRGKSGTPTGSRRAARRPTSPVELAPRAACKLGALKVGDGGGAWGSGSSAGSAGSSEGILKGHGQQRGRQTRNYKKEGLTRPWRSTSYASMGGTGDHHHPKPPSSCEGPQNLCGTGPSSRREGRRAA